MNSELWTELLETAAATQPIPTLAKVTRTVCISGDKKIREIKITMQKESASTKFSQGGKKPTALPVCLKYIVENCTVAVIMGWLNK